VLGGRVTLLRHALNTLLGRHVGTRGVIYEQARRVRVWSEEPVPVEIDGDLAGELPQEYAVADYRARFLVGRDWQG
jgi:diacylglycerol kinase family enzyme